MVMGQLNTHVQKNNSDHHTQILTQNGSKRIYTGSKRILTVLAPNILGAKTMKIFERKRYKLS